MANIAELQGISTYVSAYLTENFVGAKSLVNTGLVSQSALFDGNRNGYTGKVRYFNDFSPEVNVSDESATDGTPSDIGATSATFIKTERNWFVPIRDVTAALANDSDVLNHLSNQVVEQTARTIDKSVMNMLNGAGLAEVLAGTGQRSSTTRGEGSFVDLNHLNAGTSNTLVTSTSPLKGLIDAAYYLYKDRAWDETLYLVCSPEVAAAYDNANVTDSAQVTDTNVGFSTILGGKVVIVPVASTFRNFGPTTNVTPESVKTAYLVKAGTLAWNAVAPLNPMEVERDAKAGRGGGQTTLHSRVGYIVHPGSGYSWGGDATKFASDSNSGTDSYDRTGNAASNWTKVGTNGAGEIGVIVSA